MHQALTMVNSSVEDANFPIPSIDPEIIYRSEEERALNVLDFDPTTIDILEIDLFTVRSLGKSTQFYLGFL